MKRKCKTKIIVSQVDEGMFRSIKSLQTKNINMKDGWFKQQTKERNDMQMFLDYLLSNCKTGLSYAFPLRNK